MDAVETAWTRNYFGMTCTRLSNAEEDPLTCSGKPACIASRNTATLLEVSSDQGLSPANSVDRHEDGDVWGCAEVDASRNEGLLKHLSVGIADGRPAS